MWSGRVGSLGRRVAGCGVSKEVEYPRRWSKGGNLKKGPHESEGVKGEGVKGEGVKGNKNSGRDCSSAQVQLACGVQHMHSIVAAFATVKDDGIGRRVG